MTVRAETVVFTTLRVLRFILISCYYSFVLFFCLGLCTVRLMKICFLKYLKLILSSEPIRTSVQTQRVCVDVEYGIRVEAAAVVCRSWTLADDVFNADVAWMLHYLNADSSLCNKKRKENGFPTYDHCLYTL